MIDKILNFLFYMLFFITPLVMYPATSEIFEFNKMLFIYTISALVGFVWILKMILAKKIILKKTPLDIPIVIFLAAITVSTIFSIDIHTSLFGYYGRFNGGLISILCYVLLFYAFISNGINLIKTLKVSLISSIIVILWGIPGRFNHDLTCPTFNSILTFMSGKLDSSTLNTIWTTKFNNACWSRETNVFDPAQRMFSTLGQPNWLGAYLSVNFFIGFYFMIKNRENIWLFIVNNLYLLFNFSAILFSRSRSSLISIAVGMAIIYLYFLLSQKYEKVKKYLVGLLFLILVPVIIFKTGIPQVDKILDFSFVSKEVVNNPVKKAINNAGSDLNITESFDIRKLVWKGAIDLGLKYPLFGTGPETFAYGYFFTRPVEHNNTSEWDFIYNKAHNEYLNYFATAGFVGLVSYLFLIAYVSYYSIKGLNLKFKSRFLQSLKLSKSTEGSKTNGLLVAFLLTGWVTILITNFFGFSTTTTNLFFFLIPAFIVVIYSGEDTMTKIHPIKEGNIYLKGFSIFIVSAVTLYVLTSLSAYFIADIYYNQGIYYSKPQVNDYQKAAYYFQEALKKRGEHVYEDKLSYSLAYLSGIASYQKNDEVAKQFISASQYYSNKSIKSSPKNVLYWKTLAKNKYLFYLNDQNIDYLYEGISALNEASKLSPTDPKIYYSFAVFYSILFDDTKDNKEKNDFADLTIYQINRSIELKNNFYDGYYFKAQFLKKIGKTAEAGEILQHILDNISPNDEASLRELQEI